ncbi:MAG: aspartoacylase, partial [Flavobacteriaceae bacterium]|nr:aspartoacylase [Flavobacteriaceae bacterium]
SVLSRKIRSKEILALLPGISITGQDHADLWVSAKTFKRMGKPVFHLLGYRCTLMESGDYRMTNREFRAKSSAYRGAPWKNGLLK